MGFGNIYVICITPVALNLSIYHSVAITLIYQHLTRFVIVNSQLINISCGFTNSVLGAGDTAVITRCRNSGEQDILLFSGDSL